MKFFFTLSLVAALASCMLQQTESKSNSLSNFNGEAGNVLLEKRRSISKSSVKKEGKHLKNNERRRKGRAKRIFPKNVKNHDIYIGAERKTPRTNI